MITELLEKLKKPARRMFALLAGFVLLSGAFALAEEELDIGEMSRAGLEALLEKLKKIYDSLVAEEPDEEDEEEYEEWEAALETLDDLMDDVEDALETK